MPQHDCDGGSIRGGGTPLSARRLEWVGKPPPQSQKISLARTCYRYRYLLPLQDGRPKMPNLPEAPLRDVRAAAIEVCAR